MTVGRGGLAGLAIDTIIVLCGFAIVIYSALSYFVTGDTTDFLIFFIGFVVVCYGMGRRMKDFWR